MNIQGVWFRSLRYPHGQEHHAVSRHLPVHSGSGSLICCPKEVLFWSCQCAIAILEDDWTNSGREWTVSRVGQANSADCYEVVGVSNSWLKFETLLTLNRESRVLNHQKSCKRSQPTTAHRFVTVSPCTIAAQIPCSAVVIRLSYRPYHCCLCILIPCYHWAITLAYLSYQLWLSIIIIRL